MKKFLSFLVDFKYWYFVLILVVTLAFSPMFTNPGEPLQVDLPVWASVTHLLRTEVIPEQRWFWGVITDREDAGFVLGENYSLPLIIPWIMSHVMEEELAVKMACWITGITLILSFYFLSIRFSRPLFSALAAFLMFIGAYNIISDGMWYDLLSIALAVCLWISLDNLIAHWSIYAWILSVFFLVLIFFCHPLGVAGAAIIWVTYFSFFLFNQKNHWDWLKFFKFISIPFISILIAAPQIDTIINPIREADVASSRNLLPLKVQVGYLLNTNLIEKSLQIFIIVLAGFGIAYLWRENKKWFVLSCAIFLASFMMICPLSHYLPVKINAFHKLMFWGTRFQYWTQIIYLFCFAIVMNIIYKTCLSTKKLKRYHARFFGLIFLLFLVVNASVTSINGLRNIVSSGRQMTLDVYPGKWEIFGLFNWLNNNVDTSKTRVFLEDTNGTYKWKDDYPEPSRLNRTSHVLALSDIYTRVHHIGGWYLPLTKFSNSYRGDGGSLFGMRKKGDFSESSLFKNIRFLNCQYLVANSIQVKNFLDSISYLNQVKNIGRFRIYKHRKFQPAWAFLESDNQDGLEFQRKSSTEYFIQLKEKIRGNLMVSLAYNKRWKAYVDGKEISVLSREGLILLPLEENKKQKIHLKYEIEKTGSVIMMSIGFCLFLVFILLELIYKKRQK